VSTLETWTGRVGLFVLRYSLVLFFVLFGITKFTAAEAEAVAPLISHSPVLFWLMQLFGQQGASNVIGVVEIALGLMMAVRPIFPRVSAIGSLGTAFALLLTVSFLITTPAMKPELMSFIVKDVTLFGAALYTASEALRAKAGWRPRSIRASLA
jgi:uncharacterized membrane protein YkgB